MAATLLPTARRFLLAFACLALPFTASAQDVPVVTEDQFFEASRQGDTVEVSIDVQDLGSAEDIFSYDITLDYGGAPLDFVEFSTDTTLTEDAGMTTDQNDDEGAEQASIAAFGSDPLSTGGNSGPVVVAVFEVTTEGSGTVTFPEVAFNDVNPPSADLSEAPFEAVVGTTPIDEARSEGPGASVVVEGTVTRAFGARARLQDDSGPTGASGLAVSQEEGPLSTSFQGDIQDGTIDRGTRLRVAGVLSERRGLLLVRGGDLGDYSVEGQELSPLPQDVSLLEVKGPGGEDFESELIRAGDVSFTDPGATGGVLEAETTYTVEDAGGTTFDYRVGPESETGVIGAEIPEGTFTYEGVLGQNNGGSGADEGYRLVPVRTADGLPVEMAGFAATATESGALLKWHTASETGNAGFEVQHQGPEAPGFEGIGFVDGSGTTTAPQSYQYRLSGLEPGTHRFRLQQRDTDGSTSLTDPVALSIEAERALSLMVVGPTPVRQSARLAFTTRQDGKARVTLYNTLGQQVRRLPARQARAGKRYEVDLPVGGLPSGTYFVRLSGPTGTRAEKIVVLR